ncbi:MAG: hypothetical protein Q8O14_14600 [bacterium]|nr:hypothetical protein [bacterium]
MALRKPQPAKLTQDEISFAQVLFDPVAFAAGFLSQLDGPESGKPMALWPHQVEDVRDPSLQIVHQDGRAVGKTVDIVVQVLHYGVTARNGRMLVTAPNDGHCNKIIEEVEAHLQNSEFLMEMVAIDHNGRHKITHKPYYQMTWKNGTIIYVRPAGPTGKSVRSLHCDKVLVDEAAWYPEPAWRALRGVLNRGGQMRAYSNPNGLRNTTYFKITQPANGWKIYHWPSWIVPGHSQAETESSAKFYGGKDTAGFQHEVAGEHGAPSYAAFNLRQFRDCQRKLEKLYRVVRIDGEEFSAIHSVDEAFSRLEGVLGLDGEARGTYWMGGDLGYTNDPSELTVWQEDERGRLLPVLRVHNERMPYTYQAAMIAILDDHYDFAGLGFDAGSNGLAVEHILTTEDRYESHQFAHRLETYDFGGSLTTGYDPQGRPKDRRIKEYMTSLINGRLAARTILFPAGDVDLDWEDQFCTHTYSQTHAGRLVYSKGNDHIIDSTRTAVLRKERELLKQLVDDGMSEEADFVMPVLTEHVFD